jgi:prevent-host-death family protein
MRKDTMIVNVADAKANLSKLIELAYHGERVVIAKNNTPLVELVAHRPLGTRTLGLLRGQFSVPKDFDAPSADVEAMFYGDGASRLPTRRMKPEKPKATGGKG